MIELTDISTEESDLGFLKKLLALAYSPTHSQLLVAAAPWRQELRTTAPPPGVPTGPHKPSPAGGLGPLAWATLSQNPRWGLLSPALYSWGTSVDEWPLGCSV